MRAIAVGLLGLACLACSGSIGPTPTPVGFYFSVDNIDGPPTVIMVNGEEVERTDCADHPGAVLTPEQPGLPPLPWVVSVNATDGTQLDSWPVDGSTSYHLFIRRYGTMLEPGPNMNPGPGPMLPCPTLYFDTPQPA